MEQSQGHLHLSQPGLIKKLIAAAEFADNERVVRIPMRTDWSDAAQGDDAPLCEGR